MINERLKNYILAISLLSDESREALFSAFQCWNVPRDHFIVKEGHTCHYIFFISKGAARIYYFKNEKEITEWMALDEEFLLSIKGFLCVFRAN